MEIQHRRRELAIMEIHRRELVAILLFAVLLLRPRRGRNTEE
jgi:hypothetical protein